MEQLEKIFKKYEKNKPLMAKEAGVSLGTVYKWYDKKTIPISFIETLGYDIKVEEK